MGDTQQFALRMLCLKMQAAQHAVPGMRAIVLNERLRQAQHLSIPPRLEGFQKIASFVFVNRGLNPLDAG
ncbi:hypothetical protein GCM10027278_36770 [Paralcaligenes ginsengisoli]